MPIYEYECTDCGKLIEVIQKVDARAPGRCEACSGRLRKKISRTSFHLKGGGWYSDGYGDGKPTKPGSESKSETVTKKEDKKADKSTTSKKAASA
jgi:putative FmdB family regulatory protein